MAFVTGDVVPVSGEELPFKVVFKQGDTVLSEWLVESQEDGQSQIVDVLKSLVDDDEEDEEDAAYAPARSGGRPSAPAPCASNKKGTLSCPIVCSTFVPAASRRFARRFG
jgi:hypothetical protein